MGHELRSENVSAIPTGGRRSSVRCKNCGGFKYPGIHTSTSGQNKQPVWMCFKCYAVTLRIVRTKKKRGLTGVEVIAKIEEEITGVEEGLLVAQNKGTESLRLRENKIRVIGRCKGELRGLRFALGLLKGKG